MLLFAMVMSTAVLFVPAITAQRARQDAWLATSVLPGLLGFAVLWVVWKLGQHFPGRPFPHILEALVGKGLAKGIGILYLLFLLFMNVLILREFGDFIIIAYLPKTPLVVLHALIILLAWYAAGKGLEVLVRMTMFIVPLGAVGVFLIILLSIPDMQPARLLPVLEGGVRPLLSASLIPASWFGEIAILLFIQPQVNKPAEILRQGGYALLLMILFCTLDILATLLVFGPELSGAFAFPFWSLARYIEYRSIERVDSLIVLMWVSGMVIKTALIYYVLCLAGSQVFHQASYRKFLLPAAVLQFLAVSWFNPDTLQLADILARIWPPVALVFELGLPGLFLLVSWWKKPSSA